jgi:lipoprotein-releasing system ATP-binding protein
VNGATITHKNEHELNTFRQKQVGFIFQFHYLLNDFTALENVMLPAYIAGLKMKDAIAKANELLTALHLEERASHFPSELSGGERQRVAAARALINDPAIILADEPTGNLDAENSALLSDILYSTAEQFNKTLIVVTHDIRIARRAKTCYALKDGIIQTIEFPPYERRRI